jgi:hypothetical protein
MSTAKQHLHHGLPNGSSGVAAVIIILSLLRINRVVFDPIGLLPLFPHTSGAKAD